MERGIVVEFNSEFAALTTFLTGVLAIFTFSRIERLIHKRHSKTNDWIFRIVGVSLIVYAAYIYFTKLFD